MFQKNDEEELYPANVASIPIMGDVTEIKFISNENFVVSSSNGTVKVLKLQDEPFPEIKEVTVWDSLHKFE